MLASSLDFLFWKLPVGILCPILLLGIYSKQSLKHDHRDQCTKIVMAAVRCGGELEAARGPSFRVGCSRWGMISSGTLWQF